LPPRYPTLLDRFIDALRLVEGAYSLICMTNAGMIACRDPLGIRPLVMGRIGDIVFARNRGAGCGAPISNARSSRANWWWWITRA
jgi:amidophosphoribosyltransferase